MQRVAEAARCGRTVGALRERRIQACKPAWTLSRRALEQAIRRLARHSLVTIERGFGAEGTGAFVVAPLIEKVLPPDRIAEMAERVRAYAGAEGGPPPDGAIESDDAEAEPESGGETACSGWRRSGS